MVFPDEPPPNQAGASLGKRAVSRRQVRRYASDPFHAHRGDAPVALVAVRTVQFSMFQASDEIRVAYGGTTKLYEREPFIDEGFHVGPREHASDLADGDVDGVPDAPGSFQQE